VVLDVERRAAHARIQRGSLRDGPADQDAVDLEAQVVVQPARSVALHDEPSHSMRVSAWWPGARRFRRPIEVAFASVGREGLA
jgi:hypothetical protein